MQTEMRTSMQREAVAHLTAMDITMKCHSQFHKELAIMFDDPFERAEDEQNIRSAAMEIVANDLIYCLEDGYECQAGRL